jgi:hypothetical protein
LFQKSSVPGIVSSAYEVVKWQQSRLKKLAVQAQSVYLEISTLTPRAEVYHQDYKHHAEALVD